MRPVPSNIKTGTPYGARCCDKDTPKHLWSRHIHKGVDFLASPGTPVFAAWNGVVVDKNWGPAFGRHIVIDHDAFPDGHPGLWAGYMHLSKKLVKPGQRVRVGQLIGYSGVTGNVTGPHLHFEVQGNLGGWSPSTHHDPARWIAAGEPVRK